MAELASTVRGSPPGDDLSLFLRDQAARRFDWAQAHCLLMPADWIVRLALPDPAAGYRDLGSEADALAVIAAHGGLPALASHLMAGFPPVDPTHGVRRGDVGVVVVKSEQGRAEVGAICTGPRWAVRGERGLWIGRPDLIAAWRPRAGGTD